MLRMARRAKGLHTAVGGEIIERMSKEMAYALALIHTHATEGL